MRKVIAAFNLTIDGNCDHTAGVPDEEVHQHYTDLLAGGDVILYGRKTYELMQFWQPMVKNPSGKKAMDDFAKAIDKIPKIIFSHHLKETGWDSAKLAEKSLAETVATLKEEAGRDIFVGSRSLIVQLTNLNLIDEYQFCIQPVIAGKGLSLFENSDDRIVLKLIRTQTFSGGAVIHYYKRN